MKKLHKPIIIGIVIGVVLIIGSNFISPMALFDALHGR